MMMAFQITALIIFCLFDYAALHRCSIGWLPGYRGNCYYFSRFEAPFYSAMSFCKTIGGKLAEIDNYYEYRRLSQLTRYKRFPDFWLGVTDMYSEGTWQKATSLERQSFFNWRSGEPNSYGGQENCVLVYPGHSMTWNDGNCRANFHFVCEK